MHVLHFIYDDISNPWVGGGGAVRVHELYRRLAGDVTATVITGRYPGAVDGCVDGVTYRRLGASRPYALSRLTYGVMASRHLQRAEYDAAIFDYSTYTPLSIPANRPVGLTVHHLSGPDADARWGRMLGSLLRGWETRQLAGVRHISATSTATAALLRPVVPENARIHRVLAGVPDDLFDLARSESDFLLYFGRLDVFQKGLDTLLDAFVLLHDRHPHLKLVVAGRGRDREEVERLIGQRGLAQSVEMRGAISTAEQRELFAGARVQLMPSRFEGFGMVAAEAMAAGVPLVASDAGSLPEVVDPPRGGITVPVGNASALAAAVEHLLMRDETRAQLSRSARASAERFRWKEIAQQHLSFLQAVARRS